MLTLSASCTSDSLEARLLDFLLRPRTGTARQLTIDGTSVAVAFRRNARARRMILRLKDNGVVVTLPPRASERAGLEFAATHAAWIGRQLAGRPQPQPLAPGHSIPLRGVAHLIEPAPGRRGGVVAIAGPEPRLVVAGDAPHIPRRIADWLKAEARRDLSLASSNHADAMGTRYKRLSLRDPASRWGSCTATGHLSYSWRLILAPAFVLDYVAAHEVAHLIEMNHSARFWRLVKAHAPRAEEARRWLRTHGPDLHRYGADS
jgi:predicted metal-dependent hydrolase